MRFLRLHFTFLFLLVAAVLLSQNPNGYYNSASGKKREQLKTSLHEIIRHHTNLTYGSLWVVFRQTDERQDGTVWDMYSPIVRTLNTTSGLNREHSFPVSWWDGTRNESLPPYTDINHIYPSDAAANSAKSNHPLGVVGSNPTYNNGMTKVGSNAFPGYSGTVFEPYDEYKGDFARAYFYMVTRYQDYYNRWRNLSMVSTTTYPTLNSWAINLLLQWHRQDPVSTKEINRNEAVFRIQNNRNPFIDYPDLVEHIWGNMQNVAFEIETSNNQALLTTPTNQTTLQYGTVISGLSQTQSLFVRGSNLNGELTVLLYGDNASMFRINTTKINAAVANSASGYELKVTYSPTVASNNHKATLIIYDGGIPGSVTVNISGTSITEADLAPAVALEATNVTASGFTANWQQQSNNDSYILSIHAIENGSSSLVQTIEDLFNTGSYEVTGLTGASEYIYVVQREVKGIITLPSNSITVRTTTSSRSVIKKEHIDVWTNNNEIHIENRAAFFEPVSVYNVSGTMLLQMPELTGRTSLVVPSAGIYFVDAGGDIRKIVVR
ncbi:endonuclease [Alkaliflexus imshenetskii]|uniref:endonuclease n=1 Tax=Alkaliflexus imshenetskii TaxID=286730 RepID=UPI00047ABD96|nr:endonuclease [Alkaliflexus imshenetskii]